MSSANELKEQGNKLFIAGKFKEAVSLYTKAIVCLLDFSFCFIQVFQFTNQYNILIDRICL